MSEASLDFLRRAFGPARFALRAEELAEVLGKRSITPRVVERIRDKIKNGTFPNGKKIDGIWQLPMEVVAEVLDPTPKASPVVPLPSSRPAPSRTGRRKSAIGPRLESIRFAEFWAEVFRAMGVMEDAQELEDHALGMRAEARLARDIERAEKQALMLEELTPQPAGIGTHRPRRP